VFASPKAAGALRVSGHSCATPAPPAPHASLPPAHTNTHTSSRPFTARPQQPRSEQGQPEGEVGSEVAGSDALICPSFSAIGKELPQTSLFQKKKSQFHFPTKPENIKK